MRQSSLKNMIHEISEEEFEASCSKKSQVQYLDSYTKLGYIVFKERAGEKFYISDPYGNFRIDDKAGLDYFIEDRDKFKKDMRPKKVESIYAGLIPEGSRFPDATFARIGELSKAVGMPLASESDRVLRPDCLKIVDSYIARLGDSAEFRKKYYISMVALVGEKLIEEYKGHCEWVMNLDPNDQVWEPDVHYDKHWLAVGGTLYDFLFESTDDDPLQETMSTLKWIMKRNIEGTKKK